MPNIIDMTIPTGSFKTQTVALTATSLVNTLKNTGLFTVLATTDAAFTKHLERTMDKLLKDVPKFKSILTYHVVSCKVMAADIIAGMVKSIQGAQLSIGTTGGVMFDNAKVVVDVGADKGVIHAIDIVLVRK